MTSQTFAEVFEGSMIVLTLKFDVTEEIQRERAPGEISKLRNPGQAFVRELPGACDIASPESEMPLVAKDACHTALVSEFPKDAQAFCREGVGTRVIIGNGRHNR